MRTWRPLQRDDLSIKQLLDMAYAFERSRLILTACELDLFSVLGAKVKSAEEIASELDTDVKATERILNALSAIGILIKNNNKFSNTNHALRFLDESKPEFMGLFKYHSYLWDSWSNLTECVKTGKADNIKEIKDMDKKQLEAFIDAVSWRGSVLSHEVIKYIDLNNASKVLDLSAALGHYIIEFYNVYPNIKPAAYVYENIYPYTINHLKREGFQDKIDVISGDLRKDDIGKGYDVIFISFVIHHASIWENIELCKKVYDALNPGGQIIIQDYIVSDDRVEPEFNALLAIEMLVNSNGGNAYTDTDFWIMLKEAWFKDITRKDTEFGTSLIFGKK